MYKSFLTTREPEDPSALPHRWASLHLPVSRVHESVLQQLRPRQAPANSLRHGKRAFEWFNWLFTHFTFPLFLLSYYSVLMHANFPAAKSATPIHHRCASTSRTTTSKDEESRTRKRRATKCHRRNSAGAFPNRRHWARLHVSQPRHQLRSRPSQRLPSTSTTFSTSRRRVIARKRPKMRWTLTKCPTASRH